ncbi:hypothetical protein L228DRAFT_261425 [Xylona heveae TC161]|uniref:DNA replication regulator Sld3 C-terminal domain-containing protein n=1 Tax=Xylona heveae (strain CBS 132557 / TC161) TaxID=1328760 RepID=A0A165GIP1_XYLHT|nr:hypothetical protein L228DRAFT_261425 [Xylona heveae TC161]KZF22230.1 hypothetical protein L228DRAFT_261425 [Xylona heveae TC161]
MIITALSKRTYLIHYDPTIELMRSRPFSSLYRSAMSALGQAQPGRSASTRANDKIHFSPPSKDLMNPNFSDDLTENLSVQGKKRKRETIGSAKPLKKSITIKPYPSSTIDKPCLLTPVFVLPRSCLSFKHLEASCSLDAPPTRFFAGYVEVLEDLVQTNECEASVLISKHNVEKGLHVIERVKYGIYAICKLGKWVTIKDIRVENGKASRQQRSVQKWQTDIQREGEWWTKATVEAPKSVLCGSGRNGGNDAHPTGLVSMKPSDKSPQRISTHAEIISTQLIERTGDICSCANGASQPQSAPERPSVEPAPQDMLEMVVTQYFEALYLSKTSLAYFAKGPLSRARAAFNGQDHLKTPKELAASLRSLILSLNVMDKKYRESLMALIQSLPAGGTVSEDEEDYAALRAVFERKSRKKKCKPGKDGMYPQEPQLVEKWWRLGDNAVEIGRDSKEWAKARLARLRTRETQLQIILILEILALEKFSATHNEKQEALEFLRSGSEGSKKKPQNLTVLLDLLADRLCIWQSLNNEGNGDGASASTASKSVSDDTTVAPTKETDYNHLYDFCVEVIVPFFASRLPEDCAVLNQKLGGPVAASPARPKILKSSSSLKTSTKPGVVVKRNAPSSRKPLSRVSSDARVSYSRPQRSFARSATESAIPGLKRETSETPLLEIPEIDTTQPLLSNRRDLLKSKRFTQREVDLSMLHPVAEAKLRKRSTNVEEELREAIAAIKKPNRQLAMKDAGNVSRVQVQATPKGSRFKDSTAPSTPPISIERSPTMKRINPDTGNGPSAGIQETPPRRSPFIKFSALDS